MLFLDTDTAKNNRLVESGAGHGLTEEEFFGREIAAWKNSKRRKDQITGERYYKGEHDILQRKRTAIGPDGRLQVISNLPNHTVIDNQYAKMVDQKTNYLLGKPITFDCENDIYSDLLKKRFNSSFQRTMKYLGEDALNGGICWLFVYYDEKGILSFRRFPGYQVLPFWADDDHTRLDAAARIYLQEYWDGLGKKVVERVEIYKPNGIYRYVLDGSTLMPDASLGIYSPYLTVQGEEGPEAYVWDRFPLIPFKYNKQEIPLVMRVKSIQDGINIILSDFQNGMEQTPQNTIMVLKEYDGENLGEFRHNLSTYSAVKVRQNGGVETLTVEVNSENYKAILDVFKTALIENARGYDAKDDRLSGTPNQMNIQSMYSDIDLDANGMETEFQAAFEQLLWFINQDMKTKGEGDFKDEVVTVIFNRDILINESEAIENCASSIGILSNKTIVGQHPWTTDVKKELDRIKAEKTEAMQEYQNSFRLTDSPAGLSEEDLLP